MKEFEIVGEKRNCPFDAKKVCPVTPNVLVHPFLISTRQKRTNFFSVREKRKNKRIMRKTTLYTFGYAGSFFMH